MPSKNSNQHSLTPMTQQQNENLHRGLAYLNTILLGIVVFFTTRMVTNIDRLSDNVVNLRVEMATMKSIVDQHTKQIDQIEETQIVKPSKSK